MNQFRLFSRTMKGMHGLLPIILLLATAGQADEPPELSTVAQLRSLSPEEADRRLPVRLRGVVTYAESDYDLLYVQDETGGTYVSRPLEVVEPVGFDRFLQPGDDVELVGVTNRGKFIPHLDAGDAVVHVRIVGQKPLPAPLRPRRGEVYNPKLHNQWVEVEAFATGVRRTRRWLRVSLVVGGKPMQALVVGDWEHVTPPELANSDLRILGVYGATFNEQREMTGANFLVPSLDQITVIDHGLTRAFAQPIVPIQDLRQFQPTVIERAHVKGVVTWSDAGRGFYLSDGSGAARIVPADEAVPAVDTNVQVVGFASIDDRSLVLRDAVLRTALDAEGIQPTPRALMIHEVDDAAVQGQLVRLRAKIIDGVNLSDTQMLVLENGPVSFEARFASPYKDAELPPLGSWVAVTGIYERVEHSNSDRPGRFRLLLRGAGDLEQLRAPPWWTVERIAWIAAALGVVLLGAFAWAVMLRRRVAAQTKVIAEQIESQRLAEERSRIGRELHDTLEQYLTGVAMQIDAARATIPESAMQARQSLSTASAMLTHSRHEARRSVWDLKTSILEKEGLTGALRELGESLATGQTQISLALPATWNRLAGKAEFHLLRIAQEAVSNALKHGKASRIEIALTNGSSGVELSIHDNGGGFDPQQPTGDDRMHFGIAGMRERAGKLNADFRLNSRPGKGTMVSVHLPQDIL